MKRTQLICLSITAALTFAVTPGCGDDGTSDTTVSETGDGDGDPTGDGDGDPTGDGDGDPTGDGDGEPGDGDGEPTGDGDGEPTGDGDGEPGDLSFAGDVYPIIMSNCSCHVNGGPAMLAMPNADAAYMNLVEVAATQDGNLDRVTPGDAASSYLYQKIAATQAGLGPGNVQMPNTASVMSNNPLSDANQELIANWINDGAAP